MIVVGLFKRAVVCAAATIVLWGVVGAGTAFAGSVWFGLTSGSVPTSLQPSQGPCGLKPLPACEDLVVTVENLGYSDANGTLEPVVVEDTLPEGLTVRKNGKSEPEIEGIAGANTGGAGPVACSLVSPQVVRCTLAFSLVPYEEIEVRIGVEVASSASSLEENVVSTYGGGAVSPKTLSRHLSVGEDIGFGVEDEELIPEEEGGRVSTQAGVHPFQLTNVLSFNTSELVAARGQQMPAGFVKDLTFQEPPGLIGNPTPFPQCTDAQFNEENADKTGNDCAPQTAIGVALVTINSPGTTNYDTLPAPLFNLTPLAGEPARFGFDVGNFTTTLDVSVRTGSDYGVTIHVNNVTQVAAVISSKVTLWGVPGDPRHDNQRGWACLEHLSTCGPLGEPQPPPLLSLPTACTGPMRTTVQANSWTEPHPAHPLEAPLFREYMVGGLDGCDHLQFNPEISVTPDSPDTSTPTGLTVQVHVPQTAALNPAGPAESALRNTIVELPEGVAVNPGGADGLEACSEGLVGYLGKEPGESDTSLFTPTLSSPFCPIGSKVGTVEVETPLLAHALKGAVYLAAQNVNPFGSLLAMYLVAEDPVSGTLIKLPGEVSLNGSSGQLVTTFKNTPELPFENLRLHFFGESRAPLGTPAHCGAYTTSATFAPWSGNEASHVSSTFNITSGPNGSPCPGPALPFSPSLDTGSISNQAGGFSPFTMTMSREDGNQNLRAISSHMPPGLSGVLAGIPLCGEPQADEGLCPASSQIGETTVSVGLGGNPFTVTGGKVYLTGPYNGSGACTMGATGCAPFGLSIVNPAKAGPFDVENTPSRHPACDCLVVRAKLEVDPHTAQVTVTSDDQGPYAIPQIIEGIPLQIKHVNVTINRSGFTFNPTNCGPLTITGALSSSEGSSSTVSVPFQATNCAILKFAPKFTVTTSGKTSKANGANLAVRLSYPNAPWGSQANIANVKVELPKQLPSRLTTLQKACTAGQFEANPAGCPAASIIGHAKATTPILPVPLEGPAYFVSHGGEAFPSLIIVLQGYGVAVDLVGTTFISKKGITSSTFKTVPDVPVGTFELMLPQGPYSALTANGNLCTAKPAMPTEFVAQNGATIHESTKIAVTGCSKVKKLTRAQLLAAALKACRRKAKGHKRVVCETRARKRYRAVKAKRGAVVRKTK